MYNKLTLIGNIGNDPESRYTPTGIAILSFSLATSRKVKGEDKTTWWRITVWDKLADTMSQMVSKGQRIYVEGEFEEAKTYTNKKGETGVSLEVRCIVLRLLDRKDASTGSTPAPAAGDDDSEIPF